MGWRDRAACRGADPNLFFVGYGEGRGRTLSAERKKTAHALAICGGCPVTGECLEYGMMPRNDFGVWGGMPAADRIAVRQGRSKVVV